MIAAPPTNVHPIDSQLPPDAVTLVDRACSRDPASPAIVFEDGLTLSRQGLVERAERFGGFLRDRVSRGDRIAIMTGNRAEFMIAWIAAMACGAILVPVNPSARRRDAAHVLRDSGAPLAIVDRERHGLISAVAPSCPDLGEVVLIGANEPDGLSDYRGAADLALPDAELDPTAITNVYYTSGTTGAPKGCMVDHAYWLRFVGLYRQIYGMGPQDRLLTCLNFFYNDPSWHLLTALHSGTVFVGMRRFSVSRFWGVVREYGITQLFSIASIPSLLLTVEPHRDDRSHGIRFAVQVGVPTPEVHRQIVERWGFPWFELYGLTETGIVTAMPPALGTAMIGSGSIGLPVPGAEVRLADERGAAVPIGERGEILVRASGLMRGYFGSRVNTERAYRDGWFRTGDLAHADQSGLLYFAGRVKDIIRRSGENVSAAEVEAVLREHPLIADAAVVAVSDELRGEEIKAFVVPRPIAEAGSLSPQGIIDHCAARLAPHKVPRFIEYRSEDFPRTPSMRVAKPEILKADTDPRADAWDRELAGS